MVLLFKNLLTNKFKKKYIYFVIKRPRRTKLMWTFRFSKFYKVKININIKLKKKKIILPKQKRLNKIIKIKKFTGLFKKKINLRTAILRKRSRFLNKFLPLHKRNKKYSFIFRKRKYKDYRVRNLDFTRNIKQIFFDNRKILRFLLKKKNLKKQNKLSSYIISLLNKNSKNVLNFYEYRLWVILIKAHFVGTFRDAVFFIKKGFVSINGKVIFNENCIVKTHDCIKIVNKKFYYMFYRNNITNSVFALKKLNWAFSKFRKKNRFRKFFPKVYHWISNNIHFGFNIPRNMEVDFVNLTVFIFRKSFGKNVLNFGVLKYINFYLIRLYNWKYIV